MITGRQIRKARALLQWTLRGLAARTKLGLPVVKRAEYVDDEPSITMDQSNVIRRALEAAGCIFIDENGEGPGVRLKKVSISS